MRRPGRRRRRPRPRRRRRRPRAASAIGSASPWRSSQASAAASCLGGEGVEQVAVDLGHAEVVEALHQRQVGGLVRGHFDVGGAEDERLVALVAVAVEQGGGLGVGAGDEDAAHPHDVELEARRVEALDLLVLAHQHLAPLVAALLGARALVLDVVAGHPGLDEAADQVADVRVAAVAGVGVGDDERPVVVGRGGGALRRGHPRAQEPLVAVGGEQGAHQDRRLVGDLAERVARQVRPGILGRPSPWPRSPSRRGRSPRSPAA